MKKEFMYITLGVLFCFLGLIAAAITKQLLILPQIGWINKESAFEMYVEDTLWTNGTVLDWGNVTVGYTYYLNFTVANIGGTTETVTLYVSDVPVNCTQVWSGNGTLLAPNTSVSGDLTYMIGEYAPTGNFSISSYVQTE